MKRAVWADKQVAALVNAGFVAVTIDVDDPCVAETLSRYRVRSTPSTIITDPQGQVLQQKDGGMGKANFLKLLGELKVSGTPIAP